MPNFPEEEDKNMDYSENKEENTTDGKGTEKKKEVGEKSSETCLSCSKCAQPLTYVEKERYVSRIG